jgi:hypothetical protein
VEELITAAQLERGRADRERDNIRRARDRLAQHGSDADR